MIAAIAVAIMASRSNESVLELPGIGAPSFCVKTVLEMPGGALSVAKIGLAQAACEKKTQRPISSAGLNDLRLNIVISLSRPDREHSASLARLRSLKTTLPDS